MNLDIFRQDLVKKFFTDVDIILKDINGVNIKKSFHKIVLASSCDFFYKMFTFGNRMSKREFIINDVQNSEISLDIIKSFYEIEPDQKKIPKWKYFLEHII